MAKFEIFQEDDGDWYFNLRARNGQIIAQSEGYSRRRNASRGIAVVKKYAGKAAVKILD